MARGHYQPQGCDDFAKALGKLAKIDQLDIQALALFAQRIQPPVWLLKDTEQLELTNLMSRRHSP